MAKITKQSEDFSKWYLEVVKQADLADYSAIKGCMIIKPYGYAIWELIQAGLNKRIKAAEVDNLYFPLLIPESFLTKEKEHVKGFAPECAVVTHGGGKKLDEPLVIRPTSETIMYDTFSKWIQSYRDLPLKINQWANVVRWEMRTRPFLRTTEFLWQEGHTAHATEKEAEVETERALKMYTDFDKEELALPVRTGKKSRKETFAGALYTLATEALAKDGKAIQAGTSHNLGQGFAEAFNIEFTNKEGKRNKVWQTSWGVSTRMIGTLIVVHGDDQGLRLPPKIAPVQVVIIPIYRNEEDQKKVMNHIEKVKAELKDEVRIKVDNREGTSPGFKFNEWEMKGVPLRFEVGPKDVEKNSVFAARRDTKEKFGIELGDIGNKTEEVLEEIQNNLYEQALKFQEDNTTEINTKDEFKELVKGKGGFISAYFCGEEPCEQKIQNETKATVRIIEKEEVESGHKCFWCGEEAKQKCLFAKAY